MNRLSFGVWPPSVTKPSVTTLCATTLCAAALLLAACSAPDDSRPNDAGSHGDVEGAREESEAQHRLVLGDTDDGSVAVLDLIDESVEEMGQVEALGEIRTDGRFAYLSGDEAVHVIDSGVWTWDHGDHNHYYKASTRTVGSTGVAGTAVGAFNQATVVLDGDANQATVLDRSALEDGELDVRAELPDVTGVAVAVGEKVLAAEPGGDRLQVRSLDGADVTTVEESCTDAEGAAHTRAGLVVGCAEGALLLDTDDWSVELIAYPDGTDDEDRARSFEHRPGSTVLGALKGEEGAWVLDVRAGTWTAIEVPDVLAVSAAGEDLPLLVLDAAGTLRSFDPASGTETKAVDLLQDGLDTDVPPVIAVDAARAYVNDAAAGVVHEIDYNDDLRTARTLEVDLAPSLMVETGW